MNDKIARDLKKSVDKLTVAVEAQTEALKDSMKLTRAMLKAAGIKSPSAPPSPQQQQQEQPVVGVGGSFIDPLTKFLKDNGVEG